MAKYVLTIDAGTTSGRAKSWVEKENI